MADKEELYSTTDSNKNRKLERKESFLLAWVWGGLALIVMIVAYIHFHHKATPPAASDATPARKSDTSLPYDANLPPHKQ